MRLQINNLEVMMKLTMFWLIYIKYFAVLIQTMMIDLNYEIVEIKE